MSIHDFGMPLIYSEAPALSREQWIEHNKQAVEAFLANGGVITKHPPQESLFNKMMSKDYKPGNPAREYMLRNILSDSFCSSEVADQHIRRTAVVEEESSVKEVTDGL